MTDLPARPAVDDGNEDMLAAEYVLGVLDADARRRAELLLREHPGFARAVAAWQERLGPLADTIEPVSAAGPCLVAHRGADPSNAAPFAPRDKRPAAISGAG